MAKITNPVSASRSFRAAGGRNLELIDCSHVARLTASVERPAGQRGDGDGKRDAPPIGVGGVSGRRYCSHARVPPA